MHKSGRVSLQEKTRNKFTGKFIPVISVKKFNILLDANRNILEKEATLNEYHKRNINCVAPTIHEVRHLNGEIKGEATRCGYLLKDNNYTDKNLQETINSISYASALISYQLDYYDWQMNPTANLINKNPITIFNRFLTVIECLKNRCRSHGIEILLEGKTTSSIQGYPVLGLLPYLLLENAVKYSYRHKKIRVFFTKENSDEYITIINTGPLVKKAEVELIFNNNFRGRWAESESDGSGVGLHFAKKICNLHDISIEATSINIKEKKQEVPLGEFQIKLHFRPHFS